MPGNTITDDECKARRKELIAQIQDQIDADRDWVDDLFGWTPTVQGVIDSVCCAGEDDACDCDQVLQYYKDQCAVIDGLEAYIKAGVFTSFPKATVLATAGPLGIRPKDACCCIRKAIEIMEAWFGPAGEGLMPTPTLLANIYMFGLAIKSVASGDRTEINRARAEIELGRSRAFRKLLFDIYALCCCKDKRSNR